MRGAQDERAFERSRRELRVRVLAGLKDVEEAAAEAMRNQVRQRGAWRRRRRRRRRR
ncbi:MAG: hypothetical protein ACK4YT_14160 [Sphingomonas sp.]